MSPLKTFVAGEVLTSSDVNTYLAKQAVIVCTSGTRPGSPVEGMTIYETDTDKRLTYDGGAWTLPKNVAGGLLAPPASIIVAQTGITAETDLTGVSVPVTVGAGRRVRVSFGGLILRTNADGTSVVNIKEGATILRSIYCQPRYNSQAEWREGSVCLTPTAGAHTYKATLATANGTGTTTSDSSSASPTELTVEDLGGV